MSQSIRDPQGLAAQVQDRMQFTNEGLRGKPLRVGDGLRLDTLRYVKIECEFMRKLQLPLCGLTLVGLTLVGLTLAAPLAARAQEAATAPATAPASAPSAATIQELAARVKPALVRLRIIESSTQEGREVRNVSFGSGALISPDGYIVTNHHVAGAARAIYATLSDKREVEAKLIGTDALADLAVVKIEGANFPTIPWGDDATLRVGDPVLAFGSPLAISQSVTSGIVSNMELVIFNSSAVTLDDEDTGSIVRWIAHDAAIYPGNSGGPLINARGEMVGVNEIEFGLSGAIPASLARPVVEQLIAKGSIARAYTGLALQPRLKGQGENGVLVAGVLPASPAQKAGITPGDILLTALVAGEAAPLQLDATFAEQLPAINNRIGNFPIGGNIVMTLQRGGETKTVTLAPTLRPRAYDDDREIDGWDITASDISPLAAIEARLQGIKGALVTGVADEGSAGNARPPLEAGDVIVAVNRAPVANVADLQKATEKLATDKGDVAALVEVARGGERVLSAIRLNRTGIYDASIEVARAWLPIDVQALTPELAELLKLPDDAQGVRVTQIIMPGSGLQVGDVITAIDDAPVEVEAAEGVDGFWAMLREYNVGASAKLAVMRGGKATIVNAKLNSEPRAERELPVYFDTNFGLAVRDISYFDRKNGAAGDDQKGVSIVRITPGGWASVAGLHETDILMAINGQPTTNLKEAQSALEALAKTKPKTATFFIAHSVDTQFHEVTTPWAAR